MSSRHASKIFSYRLRELRLSRGIPQDKLGVMLGIDEGASSARMSRYESGSIQPPFAMVARIAQALGVPQAYFFCEDDALAEMILRFDRLPPDAQAAVLAQIRDIDPNESPVPARNR
jgi:transcriptional regulator with XRE-family HTH domain